MSEGWIMKRFIILILSVLSVSGSVFSQGDSLKDRIAPILEGKKATVGVAVLFDDNKSFEMNKGDYPMMSVCKFPLALAVLDYLDRNNLSLDTEIFVRKSDLLPDTYSPLRDQRPQGNFKMTIRELLVYTVSLSDNNTCDILFGYIGGPKIVDDYVKRLGVKGISISATEKMMHEGFGKQYLNSATPLSAVLLMNMFLNKDLFREEYKNCLEEILIQTSTGKDKIKALLPENVAVGHKTGSSDRDEMGVKAGDNDLAFVRLPDGRQYCIAVFVRDSKESDKTNAAIIADISKNVYDYFITKRP